MLVLGGAAKPLVGLVELSSRSGPPLPSIFHCLVASSRADSVVWGSTPCAT